MKHLKIYENFTIPFINNKSDEIPPYIICDYHTDNDKLLILGKIITQEVFFKREIIVQVIENISKKNIKYINSKYHFINPNFKYTFYTYEKAKKKFDELKEIEPYYSWELSQVAKQYNL